MYSIKGVVHSCYYETYDIYTDVYYTHYEYCIAGCCDPDVPGDQIPCCDATGTIIGTVLGILVLIAIIIKICTRLILSAVCKCHITCSHVVLRVLVFNATFSNISVISWRQVLLVEEIGLPGEKHRPDVIHKQTSHTGYGLSSAPRHERDSNSQL